MKCEQYLSRVRRCDGEVPSIPHSLKYGGWDRIRQGFAEAVKRGWFDDFLAQAFGAEVTGS